MVPFLCVQFESAAITAFGQSDPFLLPKVALSSARFLVSKRHLLKALRTWCTALSVCPLVLLHTPTLTMGVSCMPEVFLTLSRTLKIHKGLTCRVCFLLLPVDLRTRPLLASSPPPPPRRPPRPLLLPRKRSPRRGWPSCASGCRSSCSRSAPTGSSSPRLRAPSEMHPVRRGGHDRIFEAQFARESRVAFLSCGDVKRRVLFLVRICSGSGYCQ